MRGAFSSLHMPGAIQLGPLDPIAELISYIPRELTLSSAESLELQLWPNPAPNHPVYYQYLIDPRSQQ